MNRAKTALMAFGAVVVLLALLPWSPKAVLFAQDKPVIDQQIGSAPFQTGQNLRAGVPPKDTTLSPPVLTGSEKFHYYLKSTYGPTSFLWTAVGASINQGRDHIPEWGQGMQGYGKRYASAFGQKIIKRSIQDGMGAALHEDPRYHFSERDGIWQRTTWAAAQTFVTHKDSGGIRFAFSRFTAAYASAFIARQWHPEKYRTVDDGLKSGSILIGIDTGMHIFKEFWPDIRRSLHRAP